MTHHNKDGQTTNVSLSKLKAIKKIEVENCKTHVHSLVQVPAVLLRVMDALALTIFGAGLLHLASHFTTCRGLPV